MSDIAINFVYVASALLFILGLKGLSSPATARRGNLLSALGMLLAIVVTLLAKDILDYRWIMVAAVAGAIIGALAARFVALTSMPEMVALFNGSGGGASLLVGWSTLYPASDSVFTLATVVLSIVIGGLTLTGSIMAWGKLSEVMTTRAVVFGLQRVLNSLILIALVVSAVLFVMNPDPS